MFFLCSTFIYALCTKYLLRTIQTFLPQATKMIATIRSDAGTTLVLLPPLHPEHL